MQLTVFDLDHTLLNANVSYKFGNFLYNQKSIPVPVLLICLFYYASHKIFGLSIYKVHHKIFQHLFKGRSLQQIQAQVDLFIDQEFISLLNSKVIDRLHQAQKRGDYTVILSSSPDFLVGPIAQRLEVNEWNASVYHTDSHGLLSSITSVMEGEEKAKLTADLTEKLHINPGLVTVYSDSYLDLPVLHKAGKAVAVKPDRILRRMSKKKGWEIIS